MHPIYEQYPMLTPHVGSSYLSGGDHSLLLIGESHYLPDCSTQHETPSRWYSGNWTTLTEEEKLWINPAELIKQSREDNFRDKAHSIYRKSFRIINEQGPNYEDYRRVADDVVFYNYFLRPAKKGKSLGILPKDEEIADAVFRLRVERYRPSAIVFLSRLAYGRYCRAGSRVSIPMVATPHPGCLHWYRTAKKYGNKSGQDILADFVKSIWKRDKAGEGIIRGPGLPASAY